MLGSASFAPQIAAAMEKYSNPTDKAKAIDKWINAAKQFIEMHEAYKKPFEMLFDVMIQKKDFGLQLAESNLSAEEISQNPSLLYEMDIDNRWILKELVSYFKDSPNVFNAEDNQQNAEDNQQGRNADRSRSPEARGRQKNTLLESLKQIRQ